MNIVVLCAGTSTEREISIVSGTGVCRALRSKGHNARVLDIYFGTYESDLNSNNFFDGEYNLDEQVNQIEGFTSKVKEMQQSGKAFFGENVLEICKNADVVFMALHGQNGEDGKVQAVFDLYGIKYTGSGYLGSALAMDKDITKQLFIANHVPTPRGVKFEKGLSNDECYQIMTDANITFPCVIKTSCGGSSVGVYIVNDRKEFDESVKAAFSYGDDVIVEEYIKGREFSVGVLEGKALPIIEIIPLQGFYDYENKYKPGMTKDVCPAELSEKMTEIMQREAVHASKVLKLGTYSRMDFLMDENENIYCLEANTLPGMTPTSLLPQEAQVIGIDYAALCERLIESSL
ncbi:MAG: D-alanine--D-alanine ligase [Lachnospiraceae bacterium]|nr:D-alanine--D-alanine ligase [Lachnospiraceae bacterium]